MKKNKILLTILGLLAIILVGCSGGNDSNNLGTNALNQKTTTNEHQKSSRNANKVKKKIEKLVKEGDFSAAQELIHDYTLDLTEETSPDDHNNMMA